MSKVVVNKLQNTTGGSPELTWMTADGTSGQMVKSTDGLGTLAFTSDSLPIKTQDGNTTLNFPNSIASDGLAFRTDGAGNLSTFSATNPFTVSGSSPKETGLRLCDRVDITNSTPAATFTLTVPTAYTTDLSEILGYTVKLYGLRIANSNYWSQKLQLTDQSGSALSSAGYEYVAGGAHNTGSSGNPQGFSYAPSSANYIQPNYSTIVSQYNTTSSIFDDANGLGGGNVDSGTQHMDQEILIYNAITNKTYLNICNIHNAPGNNFERVVSHGQLVGGPSARMGGFILSNNQTANWIDGIVELYAHFKNGIDV